MTDTKPTIDEQIAHFKQWYTGNPKNDAILASLERLKRIQSAEMPEPVSCVENHKAGKNLNW